MTLGRLAAMPSRAMLGAYVPARTRSWPAHTRLFVVGDRIGWSIDDDANRLRARAHRFGYDVAPAEWAPFTRRQSVFYASHFDALRPRPLASSHRLGLAYFHGRPGTDGHPEFDEAYDTLRSHADRIDRVQVTHAEMERLVVDAGVDATRVFRIPIGVDLERFPLGDRPARAKARQSLGLPASAFVVGSFQKDGVGWEEGLEPKLIKGPDALIDVLERLSATTPELAVLLTGPARGYVRRGLERIGVPYRHVTLPSRDELARAYHALDAYLVTSRQEGGPKAVLESMATGAPLVTTRVGQADDLVRTAENGLIADVDDVDALVHAVQRVHDEPELVARLRAAGRATAEANAEEQLDARWAGLLEGFVHRAG
ncbi:MAG TPA: glycosyltransferase family 4 protein [Gaiellaceae bacterium]|nr:glycosyltransferase family 4 protein [Gaiellaceae bacterium]